MSMPEKIRDFGWFGAGYAVAKGGTDDPDFYPPLNDMEAQREWLGGFGAGWAECPDDRGDRLDPLRRRDRRRVGGRGPDPGAGGEGGAAPPAAGARGGEGESDGALRVIPAVCG